MEFIRGNRKAVEENVKYVDIRYITSCAKQFNRTVKEVIVSRERKLTYINVAHVMHIILSCFKSTF